jgi:hypothetical protein
MTNILATAKEVALHPNACQELMIQTQQSGTSILVPQTQGLHLDLSQGGLQAQFEEFRSHLSLPAICALSLIDDVFFMVVGGKMIQKGAESTDNISNDHKFLKLFPQMNHN